ncbi:MAG TPA: hypothetical protein VD927_09655 [Chryseosolibacter sp.]|nr:hypothetical protein [Chryseosolibacter sp.]
MNEEVRSQGQIIMAVIYLGLSIPIGLLSLGFLFSYPDEIWYLGILLATSSGLLIYSGAFQIRKVRSNQQTDALKIVELHKKVSVHRHEVANAAGSKPGTNLSSETIRDLSEQPIRWVINADTWKSFIRIEGRYRTNETIMLILVGTLIFTYVLHGEMIDRWIASFVVAFISSALLFGLRLKLKQATLNGASSAPVELIIDDEKACINGKLFYFRNDERRLHRVNLVTKQGMTMLEFTYSWMTRKGRTEDSLLLPIPDDKKEDAEVILRYFT